MTRAILSLLALITFAVVNPIRSAEAIPPPQSNPEAIRALVDNVTHYPTKFRIIQAGIPAIAPLFENLENDDDKVVLETKSALRWIARSESSPSAALLRAITPWTHAKQTIPVRAFAIYLLGLVGDPNGCTLLAKASAEPDPVIGKAAVEALRAIPGTVATTHLVQAADQAPEKRVASILNALGERGDRGASDLLVKKARDKNDTIRFAAMTALGNLGGPIAEKTLREQLDVASVAIHLTALRAYVQVGYGYLNEGDSDRAVAVFARAGSELRAVDGLGRTGSEKAIPVLEKFLNDPNGTIRDAAWSAYLNLADHFAQEGNTKRAHAGYTKTLASKEASWYHRMRAIHQFGLSGSETAVAKIAPFLSTGNPKLKGNSPLQQTEIWMTAIRALRRIDSAQSAKTLRGTLSTMPDGVQIAALVALAAKTDSTSINAIDAVGRSGQNLAVRRKAIWALGEIGGDASEKALHQYNWKDNATGLAAQQALIQIAGQLQQARMPAKARSLYEKVARDGTDSVVQVAALNGISRIGGGASLPLVSQLVSTDVEAVRHAAIDALIAVTAHLATEKERERVRAIQALIRAIPHASTGQRVSVKVRLRTLRHRVEINAVGGVVLSWWMLGSFLDANPDREQGFLEGSLDITASHKEQKRSLRWIPVDAKDNSGIVTFTSEIALTENPYSYALTDLVVSKNQEAVLHFRSESQVTGWLNGKPVTSGTTVQLKRGSNRLLLKIKLASKSSNVSAFLTDRKKNPIEFATR